MTNITNAPTILPTSMPTANTTNPGVSKNIGTEIGVGVIIGIAVSAVIGAVVIFQKLICFKIFDVYGTQRGILQDICSCYKGSYNEANNNFAAKATDIESPRDKRDDNIKQAKKEDSDSSFKSPGILPLDLTDQSILVDAPQQAVGAIPLVIRGTTDIEQRSLEVDQCALIRGCNSTLELGLENQL